MLEVLQSWEVLIMLVLVMHVTSSFQISDAYILTARPLPNIILCRLMHEKSPISSNFSQSFPFNFLPAFHILIDVCQYMVKPFFWITLYIFNI